MRICSPQLGISPNSVLGGEVFNREILLRLAKKGIGVEIILPKGKPHDEGIKGWNITYSPISHAFAFMYSFIFLPTLFSVYSRRKFDILRIHSPKYLGLGGILFKLFKPKVKLVATYHQFRETNFFLFSKFINRFWDHIFCDSNNVKNLIIDNYGVSPNKITVVYNGVPNYLKPTSKAPQKLKELDLKDKKVLLFMGLFIERKNPLFLLQVLKRITENDPKIVLIYVGKGPLEDQIRKEAFKLGLESNIRIISPIYGEEKNIIHNLADVFVHPALDEGFALAPLESMACGNPVIMNDGHSAREAIEDGNNGFICQTNDATDWVDKLILLLRNRKLLKKIGINAYNKTQKEFNWDISAQSYINVFKELLK